MLATSPANAVPASAQTENGHVCASSPVWVTIKNLAHEVHTAAQHRVDVGRRSESRGRRVLTAYAAAANAVLGYDDEHEDDIATGVLVTAVVIARNAALDADVIRRDAIPLAFAIANLYDNPS